MDYQLQDLKDRLRAKRDRMDRNDAVRLHRAISWLQSAEKYAEDQDIQFISLWVAFNTLYGIDEDIHASLGERDLFQRYVHKLCKHDADKAIYNCLWDKFSGPIRTLISNQYVFSPFWTAVRSSDSSGDWKESFSKSEKATKSFLAMQKVPELLSVVLDRLYVLRNQLMHGGATYQSQINRQQVTDGAHILATLLPIVVHIMLEASDEEWGQIRYPVVED